ncbi:hypothetical protein ABAC402_05065 [Asticcacaulis sp. AC402]|nr:hypothetical protein ABAC402_05065 [Asticcacaulis sp. AC402]
MEGEDDMLIVPRILMSVLGAAAVTALALSVMGYLVMTGKTAVDGLSIAQAILSIGFYNALTVAVLIGMPLFAWLHRRGRLTWWPVMWTSFMTGLVVIELYFVALYGHYDLLLALAAPWFLLPLYSWFFYLLAPLAGLTALLVWKTFPGATTELPRRPLPSAR